MSNDRWRRRCARERLNTNEVCGGSRKALGQGSHRYAGHGLAPVKPLALSTGQCQAN